MKTVLHSSAKASHYNKEASTYDAFNEKTSIATNQLIEKILKQHRVKTVLDMTCGTGSQVFWLSKQGYHVIGSDINAKMLALAKEKAKKQQRAIEFIKGDMRTLKAGQFDAVITIFNAIGHLTKQDFEQAIQNIYSNLNNRGLYVFDIFNLNYLLKDDNITQLTMDVQKKSGNMLAREIQYSTISPDGVLASYDIYVRQMGNEAPKTLKAMQTLQVYSASQLKDMLQKNGFSVIRQCAIDESRFSEYKTERILTVAKKTGGDHG